MSEEQTKYKTEPSGNTRELNPISLEQREEIQKYLDMPTEHGFMIHAKPAKELVKTLLSSEQAWREEAIKARKGVLTGEYMVLSDGVEVEIYKDPLIVISQLREQLNQAVEVLKICALPYDDFCGNCDQRMSIEGMQIAVDFLFSLSQEGET